jgi:acyl carrier protein
MTRDEIFALIVDGLHTTFQIDPAKITIDANLYSDLDIDSIDAVDLAVKLQRATGTRITPDVFKAVHTVRDLVDAVAMLLVQDGTPRDHAAASTVA